MVLFIKVDENNRCIRACSEPQDEEDILFTEYPDDILENLFHYKVVDGVLQKMTEEEILEIEQMEANKPTKPTKQSRIEALEQALISLMMD